MKSKTKSNNYSYHGKDFFSKKEVAENYDKLRFTSLSGKIFNDLEVGTLKSLIAHTKGKNRSKIKILEVGSGTGRFSIELAKMGFDVVCSDISEPLQKEVMKNINSKELKKQIKGKITCKIADAYNLPFDNNNFDIVVSIRVFNQLKLDKNKKDALKEISRVLKPKGTAVIEYVNTNSLSMFAGTFQRMISSFSFKPYKKSGLISYNKMEKFAKKSGLKQIDSKGVFLFSQTFFIICPKGIIKSMAKLDRLLSKVFLIFCTRIYVKLKK